MELERGQYNIIHLPTVSMDRFWLFGGVGTFGIISYKLFALLYTYYMQHYIVCICQTIILEHAEKIKLVEMANRYDYIRCAHTAHNNIIHVIL